MATNVQVIFYRMYGHVYRLAEAIAAGAHEVSGADVALYQVAELVPAEALQRSGAAQARAQFAHIPQAAVDHVADADAIIFGTPTRFGNMCAQIGENSGSLDRAERVADRAVESHDAGVR